MNAHAPIATDAAIVAALRIRLEAARGHYAKAPDRSSQLQALASMARLKAALVALEAG